MQSRSGSPTCTRRWWKAARGLDANAPPDDAELVDCDGLPIAEYARQSLDRFPSVPSRPLVAWILPDQPPRHPKLWRASSRLVQYIEALHAKQFEWIVPPMKEAVRDGKVLISVPGHDEPARTPVEQALKTGPVFVLTDAGCFSSCIMLRNLLKRMGALQVGDATGRDEVYGESWFQQWLPSKLGKLYLPIAIFGDHPEERGGIPPDLPWEGSARDEAGIRRFIAAHVPGSSNR